MNSPSFKKYQQVYDYLIDYINTNNLQPQDQLPTELDIANKLQVSRNTVQHALRELTQNNIAYRVQGGGTYLAARQQNQEKGVSIIPLVLSNQQKWTGCYNYISGAEAFLRQHPFYLTIHCTDMDSHVEAETVNKLINAGARCIMVLPSGNFDELSQFYYTHIKKGNHFVFLDRPPKGVEVDLVESDNITAGYIAAEHLVNLGHRRIAFAQKKPYLLPTVNKRYEGVCTALEFNNIHLPPEYMLNIKDDNLTQEDVTAALAEIMRLEKPPTAIIAVNDSQATTLIRAATELQLSIPRDLSIVGFDGAEIAESSVPKLTTVAQNFFEIGFHAAGLAYNRIVNNTNYFIHQKIPVQLELRDSTAPPANRE